MLEMEFDSREEKQRKAMKQILQKTRTIKALTEDIGDELDLEEECIEDLGVAIDNAKDTVVDGTHRIKRLQDMSGCGWHIAAVVILVGVFCAVCAITVLVGVL